MSQYISTVDEDDSEKDYVWPQLCQYDVEENGTQYISPYCTFLR